MATTKVTSDCPLCSATLVAGAPFCERCGAIVRAEPPAPPPAEAWRSPGADLAGSLGSPRPAGVAVLAAGVAALAIAAVGGWWFWSSRGQVADGAPQVGLAVDAAATLDDDTASPTASSEIAFELPANAAASAPPSPPSSWPPSSAGSRGAAAAPAGTGVIANGNGLPAVAPFAGGGQLPAPAPLEPAPDPPAESVEPPRTVETPVAQPAPHAAEVVEAAPPASRPSPAAAAPPPPAAPAPPYRGPLNGTLTYSGPPVVQNGEIVFERLPPTRLKLSYPADVWEARLAPGENNTQRLILKNRKPGTQRKCVVQWEVIP